MAPGRRLAGLAGHVRPLSASGGPERPLPALGPSAAVPVGFDLVPGDEDAEIASHLRWLAQKDAVGQDALLLGPPGALRRHIALRYCELSGREAEVLTVTRDTTEADLKQRRELSSGAGGARTLYADAAPVRCAVLGRVLILDGLEKAERNVLPTLNNLLENREMALDDGRFLVPARRFDALPRQTDADAAAGAGGGRTQLVRVHEAFRVIALALPCPPCLGNPLDPPLRSRFQARVVGPPLLASPAQLGAAGTSVPEALLRRLAALQRALNALALGGEGGSEALVASLPPGARPPVLTHDAVLRILRLSSALPEAVRPSVADALARAYPIALLTAGSAGPGSSAALTEAAKQWLRHFQLDGVSPTGGTSPLALRAPSAASGSSPGQVLLDLGAGPAVPVASPGLRAAQEEGFILTAPLGHLAASVAQDLAVGHDCLLVGPAGCGKSALARYLASALGHGVPGGAGLEFFFLYEEMSSRDLLQRRTTDAAGRTSWVDSPLVRAARTGALCVLDGVHRLRGDVLCALAPLLQDRQAVLAVANDPQGAASELLLRADRFDRVSDRLAQEGGHSSDAAARLRVARVHPAFKVLALAEPPSARNPWLSEELSTYFSHHVYPDPVPAHLLDILQSLFRGLPRPSLERLVAAVASSHGLADAAVAASAHVPLRVLIRVSRRAAKAADQAKVDSELLAGILQQALFPFLPRGARAELLAELRRHFRAEDVKAAAARVLHSGGAAGGPASRPAAADAAAGQAPLPGTVRLGGFLAPLGTPRRPELVPSVDFVGIGRHTDLLEEFGRAIFEQGERYILLLGPQGVGKNRVVDHLLQTLQLEREYMQLHRDTTVAQLTVTPTIIDGRLMYEDSPLIRAAQHGRILVLDEADKAPLEVVVVLKSLVEDGQLALPDGRRLARFAPDDAGGAASTSVVQIHPEFRMLVLANRPGFPFLGNDLIREADVFSVFCLDNPDAASELQLVRAVAPRVPESVLRTLVGIFADLRLAVEEGRLQYPYSTRELLAVVRHLDRFPDDPLEGALASILAFDRFDPAVRETLRPIFEKRGVPITAALGTPLDSEGISADLQQPWLRALAALRGVKLGAVERLAAPLPAGAWAPLGLPAELVVSLHDVSARPALFDPPKFVALAGLAFDRIQDGFSESVARARLPLALRAGPVVDAVAAFEEEDLAELGGRQERVLHLLSTQPLVLWSIEDPLGVGAAAGRCAALPLGPGSDWSLSGALAEAAGAAGVPQVRVNGRSVALGSPQLVWLPGAGALLLHSPSDVLAPQMLIERPHREDVRAEVLQIPPLAAPRGPTARVRPKLEDSFVAVPFAGAGPKASSELFAMANSALFFQPSGRRLVQVDVVQRQAREVALPDVPGSRPAGVAGFLLGGGGRGAAYSVSATPTFRGLEVIVTEDSSTASSGGRRFLSVLFPEGGGAATVAAGAAPTSRAPTARWLEAEPAAEPLGPGPVLPAVASGGLVSLPFGSDADAVAFAALPPSDGLGLAHTVGAPDAAEGGGRRPVLELRAADRPARRGLEPQPPQLPSVAELAKADDRTLRRLLRPRPLELPAPRPDCRTGDAAAPVAEDALVLRLLSLPGNQGDWLEAVHPSSCTVRRLPARPPEEADADVGGGPKAGVVRLVSWPTGESEPGQPAGAAGGPLPDTCAVFRDGSVRWLELHPASLERGLRSYLEVRGLGGLLDGVSQTSIAGAAREDGDEDGEEEEDEEEADGEDDGEEEEEGEEREELDGEPGRDEEASTGGPGRASQARVRITQGGQRRPGARAQGRRPREGGGGGRRRGAPGRGGERGQEALQPPGPERVRAEVLRRAQRQRRRALEAQRREEFKRDKSRDASGNPKHGDEDDEEHVGGNRWAGGTGGADTAGLGGKGGPYRLEKRGQNVHQISDEAKAQISDEAKEAARKMGEEARKKRMEEIEMGGGDYELYTNILREVQGEVEQIRRVLAAAAARQRERVWLRGPEGELDENRLVDAIAGESQVFKRRAERESRPGEAPMQPKKITFLFDTSASMYRFNGTDGRLRRSCEAAVMLMEALRGFEQKFDYEICSHDGDRVINELVPFGRPPKDEKERLKVVSKMLASAQYCNSGDNTLSAIGRACERVAAAGPADDRFVFAFSDANFARYGLTGQALSNALGSTPGVHAVCFFIATFEDEALEMARLMPDRIKVCLDLKRLPAELRQQFVSSVAGGRAAL